MSSDFLLYGANGFTGRLIIGRARELGLRPLLAGRSGDAIRALADEHGFEHRVFGLAQTGALDAALATVPVVLNAAGPFAHTAAPVVERCLRAGVHYVDITGELDVFERLHASDARARAAGTLLLPGAGFDVVPTDLLAAHVRRRLHGATQLRLAFYALGGGISRGTALTMVESAARGGAIRRRGRITRVPAAWRTRTVDFGFGTRPMCVTTIPWGDVSTAYYSTAIPNIEVYVRTTALQRSLLVTSRGVDWLLGSAAVQRALKAWIRARVRGPGEERRRRGVCLIWAQAEDDSGVRVESRMRTPEGYTLTAQTAVEVVRRVLAGAAPAGFQTPSLAYGPDWILELDGVQREDVR